MISTQRKVQKYAIFTIKRQPRPIVLFYPIVFLLFQKRKQPAGKTLSSRLFALDKAEKSTYFRRFSKKKALHNCIICAVQLWLEQLDSNQRNDGVKVRCLTTWLYPNNTYIISKTRHLVNRKMNFYNSEIKQMIVSRRNKTAKKRTK